MRPSDPSLIPVPPAELRKDLPGSRITEIQHFPHDPEAPEMLLARLSNGTILCVTPGPDPQAGAPVAGLVFRTTAEHDDPLEAVVAKEILEVVVETVGAAPQRLVVRVEGGGVLDVAGESLEILDPPEAHLHVTRLGRGE